MGPRKEKPYCNPILIRLISWTSWPFSPNATPPFWPCELVNAVRKNDALTSEHQLVHVVKRLFCGVLKARWSHWVVHIQLFRESLLEKEAAKVHAIMLKDNLSIQCSFYFSKRNKSVNQSNLLCLVLRMTFSQISWNAEVTNSHYLSELSRALLRFFRQPFTKLLHSIACAQRR